MAAGIKKGAMKPGTVLSAKFRSLNAYFHDWYDPCDAGQEVAGKLTLKHIYEIAKIKSQDPTFENEPLERVCRMVIGSAHTCGIEIVKELDAEEYGQFLEERREIVAQQEEELLEAKAAKMMRVAWMWGISSANRNFNKFMLWLEFFVFEWVLFLVGLGQTVVCPHFVLL